MQNPLYNYRIRTALKALRDRVRNCRNKRKVDVQCHSRLASGGYAMESRGEGHSLEIGAGTWMARPLIELKGSNNRLVIGKECIIGPGCTFSLVGDNLTVIVGDGTTFTHSCELRAEESGVSINVGKDCMFSNDVRVRTSDGHPMIDLDTGKRLNPPASVSIGSHVWLTPGCRVMKGAEIGDGSIVGTYAVVTKQHPANTLIVGQPARDVKSGVSWQRKFE
ncbi:MAG: acyltransferase [Candidatus Amulumruptor caecigallinarius]|nr:acyltransferase [Candidatus Amulumruptor caecigallinarius]MCM1397613.1 acyltransferase [Candidatus Amulumruptor caecigallinarius]MCM1454604.1 acyltransferase [bacterium]